MLLWRTVRTCVILMLSSVIFAVAFAGDGAKRTPRVPPAQKDVAARIIDNGQSMVADLSTSTKDVTPVQANALNPTSSSTAFAIDLRNQRKVKINLGTGAVTAFGGASGGKPFYAGDFDGTGTWYAMSNPDSLYSIDTTTGNYTFLGPVAGIPAGSNTSGLSWDYSTNTMYLCNLNGGTATLYTLNIGTLTATPIGAIVTGTVIDIAVSNAGQIYGVKFASVSTDPDSLISINKSTGAGTTVGSLGVNVNFAHGLDFDPVTDSLFYPGYIGSGVNNLYRINTITGTADLVFALAAGEYDAFAVVGSASAPPVNVINESFEGTTFPPSGWTKLSPDGGPGWNRQVNGTTPVPGWQGGAITVPPGGGNAVAFCTWNTGGATSNDQWLVTPRLTNIGASDSLSFWMRWWPSNFADTVEIRISTTTPTVANFTTVVAVLGFPANSTTDTGWVQKQYRLSDHVATGSNIYIAFRERIADNVNNGASISLDLVRVTGIGTEAPELVSTIPSGFRLEQNYPNPFNPATTIRFSVPDANTVSLRVYNALGQEVATLAEGRYQPGTYSVQWDASGLSSGIYFYRLQAGTYSDTKKLLLMK